MSALAKILLWIVLLTQLAALAVLVGRLTDAGWLRVLARTWRRIVRAIIIRRYLGRPWRIAIDRAWRTER